ncbi:MAG: 30S ribosomal protein S6 [Deltaproteobacteria bacterium]|nr:MAG: 30S ribosomal protein S6 [Deltaproteobacteria bacterium]
MLFREYETIYIMRPDLAEEEEAAVAERMSGILDKTQARLLKQAVWGKRKLAYEIKKYSKGVYVSLKYLSAADTVQELERNLKILDPVIRFQTFKIADGVDVDKRLAEQAAEDAREEAERAERERALAQQQAEAEARARAEAEAVAAAPQVAATGQEPTTAAAAGTDQAGSAAAGDDSSSEQKEEK